MTTTSACVHPIRVCEDCDSGFVQNLGGRPRRKCYDCSPARCNQRRTAYGTPDAEEQARRWHEGHDTVPAEPLVSVPHPIAQPKVAPKHCPDCGAFPAPDSATFPFCNAQHRQRFAEKVATAKRGGPAPLTKGKKGGHRGPRQVEESKTL